MGVMEFWEPEAGKTENKIRKEKKKEKKDHNSQFLV
jgi:hypothetical protein